MLKRVTQALALVSMLGLMIPICMGSSKEAALNNQETVRYETAVEPFKQSIYSTETIKIDKPKTIVKAAPVDSKPELSREDIELIALVTMAEAEGECEEGQRLVIDTILNRLDSDRFPDTIKGVIYQSNQFSSVWNGRVDRCYVSEDICQLVEEELLSRTNNDVMFFCAGGYSSYGTPMFYVENHYFSSY